MCRLCRKAVNARGDYKDTIIHSHIVQWLKLLWLGVVAPCGQHHHEVPQLHATEVLALELTITDF